MKKLIVYLFLSFIFLNLSAQIIYYRTQNINIGFGKISNSITNPHMDFCVNGPLVDTLGIPVGGYIDNGITIKVWVSPVKGGGNFAVDNVIFGIGIDNKFYMLSYAEKDKLPEMKWAFQNGPVLVRNGVNIRGTSQSQFPRSGIGFKKDGTLVVVVSLTPITFYQLADLFIEENCLNAMYLDGGPYVGCSDKTTSYGTMVSEATKLQFFNN